MGSGCGHLDCPAPERFTLTSAMQARVHNWGPWGLLWFHRTLFLLVTNMRFPDNAGESGRDAAGALLVVGQPWLPGPPLL